MKTKIEELLKQFNPKKHRIKEYITTNYNSLGESESTYIIPEGNEIQFLKSYAEDYDKYGEVSGFDGKGYKVTIVDFELIDKEEIA